MFVLWRVNRVNPIMKQNLVASSQESVASNSPWQQVRFGKVFVQAPGGKLGHPETEAGRFFFRSGVGCNSLGKKIT